MWFNDKKIIYLSAIAEKVNILQGWKLAYYQTHFPRVMEYQYPYYAPCIF